MRREVQAVRGLSHSNIVAVHDFVDDGPWSFVVMEYVAGPDLAERVRRRGPLSAEEAVRLGREVALGLAAGPPERSHPPRREATEHPARPRWPRPAHRFRLRQAGRRHRRDPHRWPGRYARLPGPRTPRRTAGRRPGGSLCPGTDAALRPHRATARTGKRPRSLAGQRRRTSSLPRARSSQGAVLARRSGGAGHGGGTGAAVPLGEGDGGGHRGRRGGRGGRGG